MENSKKIFWNKAMFWGFIVGLTAMIASTVFYATDNFDHAAKQWVEIAIYVIGIILCALSFRNSIEENTLFPYGRALGLGVSTMLFASIILAVFSFVLYKFIDPGLIDELITTLEEKYLESGLSEDMIERQIEMQQKLMTPAFMSVGQVINGVLYGLIISLITSIFMKKKSVDGFQEAMKEIDEEE
ncbi:MAG: DUF4199 domain-containing protein [Prolixibacteraceae bacterium]|nr:DUF4199 domain-containing protein [Prolixibacteraceae bacterium]